MSLAGAPQQVVMFEVMLTGTSFCSLTEVAFRNATQPVAFCM